MDIDESFITNNIRNKTEEITIDLNNDIIRTRKK